MPVDRLLPGQEAHDLIDLVRDIADKELAPRVDGYEREHRYPDGLFALLGRAWPLGLPYSADFGGGDQPYEMYLQVLEELAARWAAVAVAVSVHTLAASPLLRFGSEEQRERWAVEVLAGRQIGGYSRCEPHAGSDAAALACRAERGGDGYRVSGAKAWITPRWKGRFLRPVRPHRDRLLGRGRAGLHRRLHAGAHRVRPQDHRPPGTRFPGRRHGRHRRHRPCHLNWFALTARRGPGPVNGETRTALPVMSLGRGPQNAVSRG
ncbi:acyl-CoA dehydrogenase family protein [Streptomyces fuscichromogenes]|uniref:Acyl-CoA dehydrogenase/oxidase N-terminal domain-containing protein n=1 Tax=Streptomyces fuscichromogenes TaxID=1324013 RepID=A0A917XG46_9ACTN|nr:hypothetical protein GCM10011578_054630 [Streptomyces fuscichromogenes]